MDVAQKRTEKILSHLKSNNNHLNFENTISNNASFSNEKDENDIVIVSAVRSPITKAKRGGFSNFHWTELLSHVLKASIDRIDLDASLVNEIQVGTVLASGGGAHAARMAQLHAGFPETCTLSTTNRQCSSGLQSVATIAAAIRAGYIEIGIGAGVESMTQNDMNEAIGSLSDKLFENQMAKDCLIPMGMTSENVAEKFNITREEQDLFAVASYEKALKAQKEGYFEQEISPVTIRNQDGTSSVVISKDDGVRPTSIEALRRLKPAFKSGGTTTAGNSSQVSDGAAAVVLMSRKKAKELNIKPLAKFLSYAVVGVPPNIMGIGPAFAIPQVLKQSHLTINDIDIFEINEAFASQAYYTVKKLNIDPNKVNPLGGAIALGHPLGATGARQICTLLNHLRRINGRYGVTSMCIGTGMGAAAVFILE